MMNDKAAAQAARTGRTTLAELARQWGDAYRIGPTRGDLQAERRDGKGEPLTAPTPGELWDLIVDDYRREPVPRDFDPPQRGRP